MHEKIEFQNTEFENEEKYYTFFVDMKNVDGLLLKESLEGGRVATFILANSDKPVTLYLGDIPDNNKAWEQIKGLLRN